MNASDRRPKSIRPIEAAVLLAATALGLAGAWYFLWPPYYHIICSPGRRTVERLPPFHPVDVWTSSGAFGVVLAAWSPALLWVGWRRRERGRGPATRRPRLAACLASSVVSVPYLGVHLVKAAFLGWPMIPFSGNWSGAGGGTLISDEMDGFAYRVLVDLGGVVAPAVVGALLISLPTARGRPRGWVEWADLALGLGWVFVGIMLWSGWLAERMIQY